MKFYKAIVLLGLSGVIFSLIGLSMTKTNDGELTYGIISVLSLTTIIIGSHGVDQTFRDDEE
jgi:hypothetical protein